MKSFLDLFEGKEFAFYGVCGTCFKLDNEVFEAIEDPDDGYRSYLNSIVLREVHNCTFFSDPLCNVKITDNGRLRDENSFALVHSITGDIILEVGTDYYDDYYPCFVFQYNGPAVLGEIQEEVITDPEPEEPKEPDWSTSKLYSLSYLIKD